jgi:protein involved in polysaccharide export with SLBB domain
LKRAGQAESMKQFLMRTPRVLFLLAILVIGVTVLAGPAFAADPPSYKLGAGDKIKVTVFGEDDLSGEYDVNDQGELDLPLIGRVKAAGGDLAQIQAMITEKYGASFLVNPKVSIEVLNYRPFFILGEVKNPASYPCTGGMTVINAVVLAGGYTPRANKHSIRIRRAGAKSASEVEVDEDAPVLPGDVITVPERFF